MRFANGTSIGFLVISAISFYLIVSLFANLAPDASDPGMLKWISANLSWAYVLLGIAIVAVLVLEFINILADKKAARKFLITMSLLGFIILMSYLLSDSEMPKFSGAEKFIENGTVTPSKLQWIGTGLIASYILFGISVLAIIWFAIYNLFK